MEISRVASSRQMRCSKYVKHREPAFAPCPGKRGGCGVNRSPNLVKYFSTTGCGSRTNEQKNVCAGINQSITASPLIGCIRQRAPGSTSTPTSNSQAQRMRPTVKHKFNTIFKIVFSILLYWNQSWSLYDLDVEMTWNGQHPEQNPGMEDVCAEHNPQHQPVGQT